MTVENIMNKINKVRPFISGITVSGGECTLEKDFLVELIGMLMNPVLQFFWIPTGV
jgi:pyruvate-formate lyase-activating enzyme